MEKKVVLVEWCGGDDRKKSPDDPNSRFWQTLTVSHGRFIVVLEEISDACASPPPQRRNGPRLGTAPQVTCCRIKCYFCWGLLAIEPAKCGVMWLTCDNMATSSSSRSALKHGLFLVLTFFIVEGKHPEMCHPGLWKRPGFPKQRISPTNYSRPNSDKINWMDPAHGGTSCMQSATTAVKAHSRPIKILALILILKMATTITRRCYWLRIKTLPQTRVIFAFFISFPATTLH